jgi:alpha-L-fucosidase
MNWERIPLAEYERLADSWKPEPGAARRWARLARQAGMRYMVLTTKHHEGFCLFDTRHTDYNAAARGPGRDLVAEFVDAARAEGLRVGFYYSLMDWHHPDGARCRFDEAARRRFVDYTHGLVRELCTNYGPIDILWYDVAWPLTPSGWEAAELNAMARRLQPGIVINNRSGLDEDFSTPEQQIVPAQAGRAWEACMTFNEISWGYTPIDTRYKDAWTVLKMLRQVAAGGGNLLLNIGPDPAGGVPEPCSQALLEVGEWLREYGKSIYDASDPPPYRETQVAGDWTCLGSTAYFHCSRWPGTSLPIGGMVSKVLSARLMGGPAIEFEQTPERLVLRGLPSQPPNALATVIELQLDQPLKLMRGLGYEVIDPALLWRWNE